MIEAVVGIARGLGKRTIAEYVGNGDTVRLLTQLGVDYGQGFHHGRPVPVGSPSRPGLDGGVRPTELQRVSLRQLAERPD